MVRLPRIKTASTRRALDKWKEKAASEATRFYTSIAALGAFVLSTPRTGRFFLILPMTFAVSLNFVALEFALLVLMGFLAAKLRCYMMVNSFLRFLAPSR